MPDNKLIIETAVVGVEQAKAKLADLLTTFEIINRSSEKFGITPRANTANAAIEAQIKLLKETTGRWDTAQTALKNYDAGMQLHERNISRVISSTRGLSTAAEDFANKSTSSILRAQRGLDSYIATQERARAVEERAAQRAESMTATRVIAGGRAVDRMEAQRAKRVSDMINTMAAEQTARQSEMYPGSFLGTRQIVQARRSVEDMENKVRNTMRRFEREAEEAGDVAGQGFWTRFFRGGRGAYSLVDTLSRGQKGAAISSLGADLRSSGVHPAVGIGALGAIMGVSELMHFTKEMGKLNESIAATAQVTGMSVRQLATLQGAMTLTGGKATDADAAMRHFADQLEKGMANSSSMAAKALHAIGISQDELKSKGTDTYGMLQQVSQALNRYADDSTKAAVMTELFGRSDAAVAKFLSRFQELTPATQAYANAVDANNKKWVEADEKLNKLTLDWETLKANMAAPIIATVDIVVRGLDALGNALSMLSAAGRYVGMGADSIADMNKNIEREQRAQRGEDEPSATYGAVEGLIKLKDVNVTAPKDSRPHIAPFSTPKGRSGGGHMPSAFKEEEANMESLRQKLRELQDQYRLFSEQQDASVEHQKIAARIQQADKNISPVQRAQEDYKIAQSSGAQKIAELQKLSSSSASIYAQMLGDAKKQYEEDQSIFTNGVKNKQEALNKLTMAQKEYNRILGEANKSQIDFQVQIQKVQNQVDREFMGVAEAHQQEVQKVISQWGNAFDQIGDKLVSTIGEAIKSAFIPLKPEYWWSSSTGPRGQPLMHAHRIDPTLQMFSSLGMSAGGDLAKSIGSSLMSSIAKGIPGFGGASSFGEGLAHLIGAGSSGGIFGTGLGAVSAVDQMTQQTTQTSLLASIAVNTGGILANTAATAAVGAANASTSAVGAAGSAAGAVGGIGNFFSWVKTFLPFSTGGIVMAASGYSVPRSFGTDTVPAMLTPGETVLPVGERPSQISAAMQNMSRGNVNLHFHGPADAPSISRWFRENMTRNSGAVRSMFRNNALTPRSL